MSEFNENKTRNVFLKNRSELALSGIESVDSFDESRICVTCSDGTSLIIEGTGLSVKEVNLDGGIVEAVGKFTGLYYDERNNVPTAGIFGRLISRK